MNHYRSLCTTVFRGVLEVESLGLYKIKLDRRYLPLPFWFAQFVAALTATLPNAFRPLTVDQVRMLQSDNVVGAAALAEGRTIQGLGVAGPHAIDTIVPGYLESYRVKGQYSHYRG